MSEPRAKYSKQDVGSMYRSYLMREGPQNVGAIDWPGPKPGALEGLKFLSTGKYCNFISVTQRIFISLSLFRCLRHN